MRSVGIHTQWAELARKRTTRNVVTSLQRLEEAIDCVRETRSGVCLWAKFHKLGYIHVQGSADFRYSLIRRVRMDMHLCKTWLSPCQRKILWNFKRNN